MKKSPKDKKYSFAEKQFDDTINKQVLGIVIDPAITCIKSARITRGEDLVKMGSSLVTRPYVQLDLTIYSPIFSYRSFYDPSNSPASLQFSASLLVSQFKTCLIYTQAYLRIPFKELPLHTDLTIIKPLPLQEFIQSIILYRLDYGV